MSSSATHRWRWSERRARAWRSPTPAGQARRASGRRDCASCSGGARRGARELEEARSGRERPIALAWRAPADAVVAGAAAATRSCGRTRAPWASAAAAGCDGRRAAGRGGRAGRRGRRTRSCWRSARTTASWRCRYPAADPDWAADYAREALDDAVAADRPAARRALTCCPATCWRVDGPAAADRRDAPAAGGGGGHAPGRLAARRGLAGGARAGAAARCSRPPAPRRGRTTTPTRAGA